MVFLFQSLFLQKKELMKKLTSFLLVFCLLVSVAWAQTDKKSLFAKVKKTDVELLKALKINNFKEAVRLAKQNGETYQELEQQALAAKYYKNAIAYASKANDKKLLAYTYEIEGDFLSPKAAFKNKIKNYELAQNLYYEVNSTAGVAIIRKKIAKHAFEQKKYDMLVAQSKILLDSATAYQLNEFEKLNHCKALIVAYNKLNNAQEVKKHIDVLGKINANLASTSAREEKTDFDEQILKDEFANVMAKATVELQQMVQQQQDSLAATSSELALKKEENQMQQTQLRKQDSVAQLQKQLIAQQEELVQLQSSKNQQLIIGIVLSLVVVALAVVALIGRQIANRKLAKQKAEVEAQRKLADTERKKAEELLLNILPQEIATELKNKGIAKPRSYNMVTVLFTDFKGFTKISEKLSPEQIVDRLNYFFQKFDEIVEKHNMEKIKTIGDGYMCAGGIPIENTSNPIDAVRAGLEMQAFVKEWNREQEVKGLPTFELRVGINTGPLVAGVIGKNKFAYDVWGDTVNLASRMESSGEVGKVNISGITHTWVKYQCECIYRGKVEAKNKGEVDMYFVEKEI